MFKHLGRRSSAGRKRKAAAVAVFALACVVAVGVYAFTASNTVPAQTAGGGTAKVSGYTEKGVSYTWSLSGEDITEAHITLINAEKLKPTDVAVALSKAAKPAAEEWVDCPESEYKALSETETEVVCKFKGGEGAFESAAAHATNKFAGAGVPGNPGAEEGNELTISATSQGKVIIEP